MNRPDRDRDPRLDVARYRQRTASGAPDADGEAADEARAGAELTLEQHAQYVETVIQQAMRRGEFDNLEGAGKPLQGLGQIHDPDWWIRKKIQTEKLTGLGPPALTLRTEDAALDGKLDAMASENSVRAALQDFNKRVVDAQRQLHGGPPVVTRVRDTDAEVARWRERREARRRAREVEAERERAAAGAKPVRRWGVRRRRS